MKKPLMTVGAVEVKQCPMCEQEFLPEDGVYHLDDRDTLYCDNFCLDEEILIQEEEALNQRFYEMSRYAD